LFFAFWIFTNEVLFNDFAVKAASQRLFKGICEMKIVWRRSFKNPVAIGAFEGKF